MKCDGCGNSFKADEMTSMGRYPEKLYFCVMCIKTGVYANER